MSHDWASNVGPGWKQLVNPVVELVRVCGGEITTVKEKFGTLRIYGYGLPEWAYELIDAVEHRSASVCEDCGAMDRHWTDSRQFARVRTRQHGWLRTLCDRCERLCHPNDADIDPKESDG